MIDRLRALPTAAISDALDRIGIEGALHGIAPLNNGFRAAGPAFTVRYAPGDGSVGDFLDDVPPGSVIVRQRSQSTSNASPARRSPCKASGATTSRSTVVGTAKEHTGRFDVPVRVGGVVVSSGDLVVGDVDGVVVVPAPEIEPTLARADDRVAAELEALAAIRSGTTTLEYYGLAT